MKEENLGRCNRCAFRNQCKFLCKDRRYELNITILSEKTAPHHYKLKSFHVS